MPISETTFGDRLQQGREMQAAIAIFSPPFAPADPTLAPAAFLAFLDALDTLTTNTGVLVTSYSTEVETRNPQVADIKDRAMRALAYLKSNVAWLRFLPGIKGLVDKIRGNRPRKPKAPAPGEGPTSPAAKKRNTGEQSFGDIAANFERLVAALGAITGYAPPAAELSIANLTILSNDYSTRNAIMSTLAQQIGLAQRDRLDGFNELTAKKKAIKQAVKSQYGNNSAENAAVKGIGL